MAKRSLEQLLAEYINCALEYEKLFYLPGDAACGRVNRKAVRIYCKIREDFGDDGLEAVVRLLEHPNRFVRCKVAYHVVWHLPDIAVDVLRKDFAIGDEYGWTHRSAFFMFDQGRFGRDPYVENQERLAEQREKKAKAKIGKAVG